MDPALTVVIVVAAVAVAGALVMLGRRHSAKVEQKREELTGTAQAHRQEADAQVSTAASVRPQADEHRRQAEEHAQEAERHGGLAEEHATAADDLEARSERAGQAAARHDEKATEAERELGRTN